MISSASLFLLIFGSFMSTSTAFLQNSHTTAFQPRSSSSSSSSHFMSTDTTSSANDGERRRRMAEFLNLEPLIESDTRKERKARDVTRRAQFACNGDDLWKLRDAMSELSEELSLAMQNKNNLSKEDRSASTRALDSIREHLEKAEQRDPDIVYKVQLELMAQAEQEGRMVDAQKHKELALEARSCLPQFNLEGLWVGKYGNHGYEMVNVTYAGDLLVAYKVTGDKNVPRGEITFQADLCPLRTQQQQPLSPIMLTPKAKKKWGTQRLPRHHGLGQVAEEGFQNNQWMDGQLILIGEDYFSFAWVPIEHQIFFGRPSAELALKMLRDAGNSVLKDKTWKQSPPSVDDDLAVLKDYAAHCLEVTAETIDEDLKGDAFGCIWHGIDSEECYFE